MWPDDAYYSMLWHSVLYHNVIRWYDVLGYVMQWCALLSYSTLFYDVLHYSWIWYNCCYSVLHYDISKHSVLFRVSYAIMPDTQRARGGGEQLDTSGNHIRGSKSRCWHQLLSALAQCSSWGDCQFWDGPQWDCALLPFAGVLVLWPGPLLLLLVLRLLLLR